MSPGSLKPVKSLLTWALAGAQPANQGLGKLLPVANDAPRRFDAIAAPEGQDWGRAEQLLDGFAFTITVVLLPGDASQQAIRRTPAYDAH